MLPKEGIHLMNSILLTGGGFANKGAEALLKTVRAELGKRLEQVRFQAIVPTEHAADAQKAGFIPCYSRSRQEFIAYHLGRVPGCKATQAWAAASQAHRYHRWMSGCDTVLDVSGYMYTDKYGIYPMQLMEKLFSGCCAGGVPYVFMPQAWGPFNESFSKKAIQHVAERSALLYSRDKTSLEFLQNIPNIRAEKLKLAPDIVLKFEPRESRDTLGPLEQAGLLHTNRRRVGICPNIRIYHATQREGIGPANPYVQWLAKLCKRFLVETDVELVLFPHEISPNWWHRDDRYVCRLVCKVFADNKRIRYFSEHCSADTLKLLIRELDFLVGSRFHSIIAALSLYVPTVAVGWSHKYQEVLNDAGIGELAFSYKEMSEDSTITRLLETWANREHVRHRLERSIPLLRRKVDDVFDQVAEILRSVECC
jgi:colanic acid/amylovoran biosynthesis protein